LFLPAFADDQSSVARDLQIDIWPSVAPDASQKRHMCTKCVTVTAIADGAVLRFGDGNSQFKNEWGVF